MPRVNVPVTSITRVGIDPPAVVAGDSVNNHSMVSDGNAWLEIDNADATNPHTMTVPVPPTVDGQAVASRVYTIPATTVGRRFGPWPVSVYGRTLNFNVSSSQLKLRAFRLGA